MALRIDATGEYAHAPNPWSGGAITLAFWFRRTSTSNQFIAGLVDTDDATPQSSGDPRVTCGTSTSSTMTCGYTGNGGTTNNGTTATYSTSAWQHCTAVFKGSGNSLTQAAVAVNGTLDAFSSSTSRDLTVNGSLDQLWIGAPGTNSNVEIAHFAYFAGELSESQITELQTKLPSAITGATPVVYCPMIGDALNDGSGGATYDFTLVNATIDSTNDGSLPSLSGGGGDATASGVTLTATASLTAGAASGDASVTANGATLTATASLVAGSASGDGNATASGVTLTATASLIAGSASSGTSGDIRLQFGLERERGALASSLTGIEWWVFGSDRSEYAHGTGLALDSNGVGYVDLDGSPFAEGDRVLVAVMTETAEAERLDRTVRSGIFYVPAIAQA